MNLVEIIRMARDKKAVDLKLYDKLMKIARNRTKEARANVLVEQAKDSEKRYISRRNISTSIY